MSRCRCPQDLSWVCDDCTALIEHLQAWEPDEGEADGAADRYERDLRGTS